MIIPNWTVRPVGRATKSALWYSARVAPETSVRIVLCIGPAATVISCAGTTRALAVGDRLGRRRRCSCRRRCRRRCCSRNNRSF